MRTLLDLAKTPKPFIRLKTKCNTSQMQKLEIQLASFGIDMKDSSCFVKDGKTISKNIKEIY